MWKQPVSARSCKKRMGQGHSQTAIGHGLLRRVSSVKHFPGNGLREKYNQIPQLGNYQHNYHIWPKLHRHWSHILPSLEKCFCCSGANGRKSDYHSEREKDASETSHHSQNMREKKLKIFRSSNAQNVCKYMQLS